MKIKTSELTDAALDWAVAKCEGVVNHDGNPVLFRFTGSGKYGVRSMPNLNSGHYRPQEWKDGGPIIEREHIELDRPWKGPGAGRWSAWISQEYNGYGDTALIAAMRCHVASKLGDEIDIPDELTKEPS